MTSCLVNLSRHDIETPKDTIFTLQWVLNKIDKMDFIYYFEELFTGDGNAIVKQFEKLISSTESEEKKLWTKIQEMFKNIIIKLEKLEYTDEENAVAYCVYYFPDKYYVRNVKINLYKNRLGWRIIEIKGIDPANP